MKSFGKGDAKRNVLDGVSIEINAGEFVSVMGPSGSGKSTLMFAMSGMDRIDSGKVAFDGNEIMKLLAEIHRIGTTILLVTHDVKVAAKTERILYLFDGKIAGEYLAGAYDETCDDLKAREEQLTSWLTARKF